MFHRNLEIEDSIKLIVANNNVMYCGKSNFLFRRTILKKNITIELTDGQSNTYLKRFDKNYGARPLQRLIQKEIKEPLRKKFYLVN